MNPATRLDAVSLSKSSRWVVFEGEEATDEITRFDAKVLLGVSLTRHSIKGAAVRCKVRSLCWCGGSLRVRISMHWPGSERRAAWGEGLSYDRTEITRRPKLTVGAQGTMPLDAGR